MIELEELLVDLIEERDNTKSLKKFFELDEQITRIKNLLKQI